jgi:hypothetical protein
MLKFSVSTGCLIVVTFSLLFLSQTVLASPEIVGAPKCKSCHKAKTGDQWKIWTESAHARAFETLASEQARTIASDEGLGDPQTEEACLKCHSTLASLGGGIVINEKGKYADSEGVGCESCHGAGSDYKPRKVMVDHDASVAAGLVMDGTADGCIGCHNELSPTYEGFDFELRWAEIAHPVKIAAGTRLPQEQLSQLPQLPQVVTFTSSVGDVHFSHEVHAGELEIDCADCHHQIHAVELDTPHPDYLESSWITCQGCHNPGADVSGQYYKCSDCHQSDLNNIADETLSSKVVIHESCWQCHESGTGVQASEGCAICHIKEEK